MNKLLIILVSLSALACGVLPVQSVTVRNPSVAPTPPALMMRVIAPEALNIRAEPSERSAAESYGLSRGDVRKVYLSCTGYEIREWVSINADCTRWVNSNYLEVVK